jgi:hypothetical protein
MAILIRIASRDASAKGGIFHLFSHAEATIAQVASPAIFSLECGRVRGVGAVDCGIKSATAKIDGNWPRTSFTVGSFEPR